MDLLQPNILIIAAGFGLIAIALKEIGRFFTRIRFPLITGFLITGMIAGPYILGLIPAEAVENLRFIDEIALAFIAFAAGSELYLEELRSRFRSIAWIMAGNTVAIPVLGSLTVFFLADFIPLMQTMPLTGRIAVSLLAGAILVARSPSSAIAIISELRVKGPFTQTVLGVTMVTDVVVIFLFAFTSSVADALLSNLGFSLNFIGLLAGELLISLGSGYILGKILEIIFSIRANKPLKIGLILLVGYSIFLLSTGLRLMGHQYFSFELFLEPLLICMIGSFMVTNYTEYRTEFLKILHEAGPPFTSPSSP